MTLCRFDGDNGEYSLLLGRAKGVDGPKGMGTYLWVEVENIKSLEAKIVEGPYIHHCVGIHKDVVPVLYEACKMCIRDRSGKTGLRVYHLYRTGNVLHSNKRTVFGIAGCYDP